MIPSFHDMASQSVRLSEVPMDLVYAWQAVEVSAVPVKDNLSPGRILMNAPDGFIVAIILALWEYMKWVLSFWC